MTFISNQERVLAMGVLLRDDTTEEERQDALAVITAYDDQAADDCTLCRHFFGHSTSDNKGEHDRECAHHPDRYGDLAERVMCFGCGRDTSMTGVASMGATAWATRGNYGSALVDRHSPEEPGELRIEICDVCLCQGAERVLDTSSGKLAPWEPERPPQMVGETFRIYKRDDGRYCAEHYDPEGWRTSCTADSFDEVLIRCGRIQEKVRDAKPEEPNQ